MNRGKSFLIAYSVKNDLRKQQFSFFSSSSSIFFVGETPNKKEWLK